MAGYHDRATAYRAVRNYYFGQVPHPDADTARELWRERLELLWHRMHSQVRRDHPKVTPTTIQRVHRTLRSAIRTAV